MDLGISVVASEKQVAKQASAWAAALPADLENAHANRRGEWLTSRAALTVAFEKAGVILKPAEVRFKGFQQIEGLEEWRFSISHTHEWALVWLIHRDAAIGIGTDVEKENRKMSSAAAARVIHADDYAMKPLALWSLKEAAFKSLPIDLQDGIQLPDIVIEENRFRVEKIGLSGHWRQENIDQLIRSYAWRSAD